MRIFRGILSVPQNIIMDLNNVDTKYNLNNNNNNNRILHLKCGSGAKEVIISRTITENIPS